MRPGPRQGAASGSITGALHVAGRAGPAGADLASTAREAFMTAASGAELVAAMVAVVGAALALRYLPAREGTTVAAVPAAAGA